jgi:hypothetical protein
MFAQPTQSDVRRFFCEVHQRLKLGQPMDGMHLLASPWVEAHPEYASDLQDANAAVAAVYTVESGQTNPFLHLSMHLSISEQCSVDQPRGVKLAVQALAQRLGSLHDAHHVAMDALGRMMWEAQRSGRAPDGDAYIESLKRAASKR